MPRRLLSPGVHLTCSKFLDLAEFIKVEMSVSCKQLLKIVFLLQVFEGLSIVWCATQAQISPIIIS